MIVDFKEKREETAAKFLAETFDDAALVTAVAAAEARDCKFILLAVPFRIASIVETEAFSDFRQRLVDTGAATVDTDYDSAASAAAQRKLGLGPLVTAWFEPPTDEDKLARDAFVISISKNAGCGP